MKIAALCLMALALTFFQSPSKVWGQTAAQVPRNLPKAVPGRMHLLDGSTLTVSLVYLDYNKIVAVDKDSKKIYTPLEVGSFVMKQDSFIVLKDFKVAVGEDEQEYRIAFVQVGVVGPGFVLYHFKGTMRRDDAVHYRSSGPVFNGTGWSGGGGSSYRSQSTEYVMSKVWFIKREGDPRWLGLPDSGSRLTAILEPMIADDKKLTRSIEWNYLFDADVPKILAEYVSNKTHAGTKP